MSDVPCNYREPGHISRICGKPSIGFCIRGSELFSGCGFHRVDILIHLLGAFPISANEYVQYQTCQQALVE